MPGARWTAFTFGAISERLADYILGTMSFTTPVPYQDDIGHDFHCVLKVPGHVDEMSYAGPSFSVQVKSNYKPLVFEEVHERQWIGAQRDPFFICVVEPSATRCDIYSTWTMHNAFQLWGLGLDPGSNVTKVRLLPRKWFGTVADLPTIKDPKTNRGVLDVPLGPPILQLTPDDVRIPADAQKYADILRDWINLERANIVREEMGMYWVYGPRRWEPNKKLPKNYAPAGSFHVNVLNLYPEYGGKSLSNFIKSTVAFAAVLAEHHEKKVPLPEGVTPRFLATLDALVEQLMPAMDVLESEAVAPYLSWRSTIPKQASPAEDRDASAPDPGSVA